MLIFDSFPSVDDAKSFRAKVGELEPELEVIIYLDAAMAFAADPILVELVPPVVHVERPDQGDDHELERVRELRLLVDGAQTGAERELQLEQLVEAYGGKFVGT